MKSEEMTPEQIQPELNVAPSPHVHTSGMTSFTMMRDVLIALSPVILVALLNFRWLAVKQLAICLDRHHPGPFAAGHGPLVCGMHRIGSGRRNRQGGIRRPGDEYF